MLNSSKLDEPMGAGASRRPKTAGKKRRNMDFGSLLSPTTPEVFARDHWERVPLFVQRSALPAALSLIHI